jgi:UDP-N-acetylglucosamine diphosphorylase/glucosamine-1-phosphate N-acetyltransferase
MTDPVLYVFDDRRARAWAPFSLTRPVGEMRYGVLTLRERSERVLGLRCDGHLAGPHLDGYDEPGAAPVLRHGDLTEGVRKVFLSSRAAPDFHDVRLPEGPARLTMNGETVGWVVPPGAAPPPAETLLDPHTASDGPTVEVAGEVLAWPWSLVAGTPRRVARDVNHLYGDTEASAGVIRVGDGLLSVGEGASIEPGVVVDTRGGPVRIDDGATVEGPGRLVGPLYVGGGTTVFGGTVGTSSIGPACKVRGEVADSVLLGFVNKAHDGFLGHALLGCWVNLGALTTNSDLKNNYGSIRVWTPEGPRDTGLVKVGCFLGDHVKTGIGTVLNTGTVVGVGSNIFGGLMPPSVVPPFSWGVGMDLTPHRLDKFFETAEIAMARRGRSLTPGVRAVLERVWQAAHPRQMV